MHIETGVSIIMNRWLEAERDELILFVTDEAHQREAEAVDRWARSSDAVVKTIMLNSADVQEGMVIEELEEQFRHCLIRKYFQLVCILQIHNLVADIIGSLHQIHQWMTHIS